MADKIWFVDDTPSKRFPLYTRGNIGEVFPVVVSPLTWTLYGGEAEMGWRDAWKKFGVYLDRDLGTEPMGILGCFGGYGYLNASYIRVFAVRTPGLTVELMDHQFFGESDAPPYVARTGDRSVTATLRVVRTALSTLGTKSLPDLEDDKRRVSAWLRALPAVGDASDEQLLDALRSFKREFRHLFGRHILMTFQASLARGLVAQICEQKLGDPALTNVLLGGIGEVESAAPSFAMWELSRLDAGSADFDAGFARFLEEFGSRGPNEWEGSSETWGTQPELALAAIDCMRAADDSRSPTLHNQQLAREREAAIAPARSRLGGTARFQFDRALRSATLFSQARERSKTTVVRALHGARLLQRELAGRGRERGGPPELTDMWLVTEAELPAYVRAPNEFTSRLDERRELRDRLSSLIPPFVFEGAPPPPETWERRDTPVAAAKAGVTLSGIAGCPGVARGRARVVLDPLDPRGLAPGDVLVAPITDPAWTPLFVAAEAVVVDVGAELSHAIIVARELGIPAVVSVTGATRSISDGALLEVDGTAGTVRVLET
jgi:pyruvate,water dikinase